MAEDKEKAAEKRRADITMLALFLLKDFIFTGFPEPNVVKQAELASAYAYALYSCLNREDDNG